MKALYPLMLVANLSQSGFMIDDNRRLPRMVNCENLPRCNICPAVRGLATDNGRDLITAMPFHVEPTMFPTLFEKPPSIPLLITPICLEIKELENKN